MSKETIGYVHLEWTCPSCGSRNEGRAAKCNSCGAPQPEDVQFEQAAQETLITDEKVIKAAEQGPDIHCPFCGTRNPVGSDQCGQCMAELSEAAVRTKGQVVGAHRKGKAPDVVCPYCQSENPATALKCGSCGAALPKAGAAQPKPKQKLPASRRAGRTSPILIAIVGLILVGFCIFFILTSRTEEMSGRVTDASWTRTLIIEGLVPVEYEDWADSIPSGAEVGSCREAVRQVQDNPAPNSDKVCGTPYTVDTGTGIGEVVQDCVYQVYDDLCSFVVPEWRPVDEAVSSGRDFSPAWPEPVLAADQRLGGSEESYTVDFDVDGRLVTYRTSDPDRFAQFTPDSRWILEVNTFDAVMSAEPAD